MNFLDALQIGAMVLALSSCGKAPELPTDTTTPNQVISNTGPDQPTNPSDPVLTQPPTTQTDPGNANVTIQSYGFYNTTSICAAMKSWVPSTTTIEFPVNSHQPVTLWYIFRADGVWVADANKVIQGQVAVGDTTTIQENGALYHPPVCYITVTNGQLASVQ